VLLYRVPVCTNIPGACHSFPTSHMSHLSLLRVFINLPCIWPPPLIPLPLLSRISWYRLHVWLTPPPPFEIPMSSLLLSHYLDAANILLSLLSPSEPPSLMARRPQDNRCGRRMASFSSHWLKHFPPSHLHAWPYHLDLFPSSFLDHWGHLEGVKDCDFDDLILLGWEKQ
jgi:hypothetical protein